ncbi:NFACT family protein [bacterium]|nr:NFACT family protein [bacterium]
MLNFDSLTLKAFVNENEQFLNGASLKKIQQPSRRELILQLRNYGENKKLYININPEFFHICFVEDFNKRGISIPNEAPMFCMLLRKYIYNAKISNVIVPMGERILEFHFEYKDVLQESQRLCLTFELMGKYSNIILYNFDTKIILGCAHNVGEEKSKYRELAGTLPYIYPQQQLKTDITNEQEQNFIHKYADILDTTSFAYEISSDYFYFTNPLVKQFLNFLQINELDNNALLKFLNFSKNIFSFKNLQPSLSNDFDEFSPVLLDNFKKCDSFNSMINDYFEYHQIQKLLKQKKEKLYFILNSKIKKLKNQIGIFKTKLLDIEKADIYKNKADILMTNIYAQVKPIINLINPYNDENIQIELDTNLNIVQNANRYYKLYKKTKTAIEYSKTKIEELNSILAKYEEQVFYIEIASNLEEINEVMFELDIKNDTEIKKQVKKEYLLENFDIEGFKVFVGKNSLQNDYLLSKIAAPEDLWFHPLNMPGAHLILKKNNKQVPDNVLLQCAKLTKKFSKTSKDIKIPIIYTERKYVKKANSKIAFVTYRNEKEIYC